MHFTFDGVPAGSPAHILMLSLIATATGIVLLIAFILLRRAYRNRYFLKRDRRIQFIHRNWQGILSGDIPVQDWFLSKMDRNIVEKVLLDRIAAAESGEIQALQEFARHSGLRDRRMHQVRHGRGWNRRLALLALGRMQLPESVPALSEALSDPSDETVVDAIRGLGRVGTPEAGRNIIRHVSRKPDQRPLRTVMDALAQCYASEPQLLLAEVQQADDVLRPILARALAEVADQGINSNLADLALDPLAEVRASAARIISSVKPPFTLNILQSLTDDSEWFVRLRAAAAVGTLRDKNGIPMLVTLLCDPNRFVRLRAASELVCFKGEEEWIIRLAMETRDLYAMQALISEFERSGRLSEIVDGLAVDAPESSIESFLLAVLQNGFAGIITDLLLNHPADRVRMRLAGILMRSKDASLMEYLAHFQMAGLNEEQMGLLHWVASGLGNPGEPHRPVTENVSA
jgi:HEAT repeat protein